MNEPGHMIPRERPPDPNTLLDNGDFILLAQCFGVAVCLFALLFCIGLGAGLVVVGFRLVTGG